MLELLQSAESAGIRLEMVGGVPYWEAMPGRRHHDALMGIRDRLVAERQATERCGCHAYVELLVRFPDGSLKTPDLSLFCDHPEEEEGPVSKVPDAVLEVVSPGYERKDLEIGPPFYLAQGVRDVVVFDPRTIQIWHFTAAGREESLAPTRVRLACGCAFPIAKP